MDAIGGYFGLDLKKSHPFHGDALRLNSARNGFEYVLRARGYRHLYMPFYTCGVMFEAPRKLGVPVSLYGVNERLEPLTLPDLQEGEAFVYTNYFGLKQGCVEALAARYGERLFVDNAQAFFTPRIPGIDSIYSPRKFFGVPDGGYLYTDARLEAALPQADSLPRMAHLLKRAASGPEAGFADFQKAEASLDHAPLERMSDLTSFLLESFDYGESARKRLENYRRLDQALGSRNRLCLPLAKEAVPMVYPFRTDDRNLRKRLIENRVYVARYWDLSGNGSGEAFPFESGLAEELIPLPVDQRYGPEDMERIIRLILD